MATRKLLTYIESWHALYEYLNLWVKLAVSKYAEQSQKETSEQKSVNQPQINYNKNSEVKILEFYNFNFDCIFCYDIRFVWFTASRNTSVFKDIRSYCFMYFCFLPPFH